MKVIKNVPIKTVYCNENCDLEFGKYANNNRLAITLKSSKSGEPMMIATVNLIDEPLTDDCVHIKNWSENKGILDSLVKAGIIEDTGQKIPTGYVEANLCKLLIDIE